jgi:ribosomal protein S18 acetylase RimI-like enzyme
MVAIDSVTVRSAIAMDRGAIMTINKRAWEHAYAHIFTQDEIRGLFNNALRQRGSWVVHRDERLATLVAEIEQTVVGFIGIGTLLNDTAGEITTFYVHPDYQGMGVGTQLWQRALGILRDQGRPAAWVWVLARAHARHFYEAQGCRPRAQGTYSVGDHDETALGYWLAL